MVLSDPTRSVEGRVISLSLRRDTLGYREAAVRFPCVEVSPLAANTLPCTLTTDAGPYLHYIFGM